MWTEALEHGRVSGGAGDLVTQNSQEPASCSDTASCSLTSSPVNDLLCCCPALSREGARGHFLEFSSRSKPGSHSPPCHRSPSPASTVQGRAPGSSAVSGTLLLTPGWAQAERQIIGHFIKCFLPSSISLDQGPTPFAQIRANSNCIRSPWCSTWSVLQAGQVGCAQAWQRTLCSNNTAFQTRSSPSRPVHASLGQASWVKVPEFLAFPPGSAV